MLAEGNHGSWVICDTHEGPLRRSNSLRRFCLPMLSKAGVAKIRFHDLQHTCATLLSGQNVHAKIVQGRFGHASISMTLDTYSHVLPSMQLGAVSACNKALQVEPIGYTVATELSRPASRDLTEVSRGPPESKNSGAPGWTRTSDHRLRRPMLYPTELRAHSTRVCQIRLPWGKREADAFVLLLGR